MIVPGDLLTIGSGGIVGFVLGLVGGGGSILAVPLLVYVVGIRSPHIAIGTSAVAVAASALFNLAGHARAGNVKWPCGLLFAASGAAGAYVGSLLGKRIDGDQLLAVFGFLMIVVAAAMLRRPAAQGDASVRLTQQSAPRLAPPLVGYGVGVGTLSGLFGIGGGFLVVPGLLASTRMPMLTAVGSSLVSVATFGATTAASYAWSGLVDWRVAALFVAGGVGGGVCGGLASQRLAKSKGALSQVFAAVVAVVGVYVAVRGLAAF
jgi:uncharacterized protein